MGSLYSTKLAPFHQGTEGVWLSVRIAALTPDIGELLREDAPALLPSEQATLLGQGKLVLFVTGSSPQPLNGGWHLQRQFRTLEAWCRDSNAFCYAESMDRPPDALGWPWQRTRSITFAQSLEGAPATLRVVYLDRSTAGFDVAAGAASLYVQRTGTGRWLTAELAVSGTPLVAAADGAHICIVTPAALQLHLVALERRP